MTVDQAFSYIESFTNLEKKPVTSMRPYRLDRMKALLELFGNPQNQIKTVHISGSKGKGSTGVYIASALKESGLVTGLYTSPHVSSYKERITIAGQEIEDEIIVSQAEIIRRRVSALDASLLPGQSDPTTFELLTLLAYLVFVVVGCQWAVIETGIGGRLDATNVLLPNATVHTLVELEHTEILGNTVAEIAFEKAGIMKPGIPAFCGHQKQEAEEVFANRARQIGAPITFVREKVRSMETFEDGSATRVDLSFDTGESASLTPGMMGAFQVENAVLAYLVADHILRRNGVSDDVRRQALRNGITKGRLPGRMELLRTDPPIMLDAAHTPSSVQRLLESYTRIYPDPALLIFGSVLGKNPGAMAKILAPAFKSVIISTPGTFKQSDPEAVYREFRALNDCTELILDPEFAFRRALAVSENRIPILVAGSFYMIGEIRRIESQRVHAEVEQP